MSAAIETAVIMKAIYSRLDGRWSGSLDAIELIGMSHVDGDDDRLERDFRYWGKVIRSAERPG